MTNKELNEGMERKIIEAYLSFYEMKAVILEHPIVSIAQSALNGQCIPDAILDNGYWVEVTTFSRNENIYKKIMENAKGKNRHIAISEPYMVNLSVDLLLTEFAKAVKKKTVKDYTRFTQIAKVPEGILLVFFNTDDPFFDEIAFSGFISRVVLKNCPIENSFFTQVFFGCFLRNTEQWKFKACN